MQNSPRLCLAAYMQDRGEDSKGSAGESASCGSPSAQGTFVTVGLRYCEVGGDCMSLTLLCVLGTCAQMSNPWDKKGVGKTLQQSLN